MICSMILWCHKANSSSSSTGIRRGCLSWNTALSIWPRGTGTRPFASFSWTWDSMWTFWYVLVERIKEVCLIFSPSSVLQNQTKRGTALHEAILGGKIEIVRLLLEYNANIGLVNEQGQRVEELLHDLNTPVAKKILKLIKDFISGTHSSGRQSGLVSPNSESLVTTATLTAGGGGAGPGGYLDGEDLTLVDSILNEDVSISYRQAGDDDDDDDFLMDDGDELPCISPPPGYSDMPPDEAEAAGSSLQPQFNQPSISPVSSLFSTSVFSELAFIFNGDDGCVQPTTGGSSRGPKQMSSDDRTSYASNEDILEGMKLSNSFLMEQHPQPQPQLQHGINDSEVDYYSSSSSAAAHHRQNYPQPTKMYSSVSHKELDCLDDSLQQQATNHHHQQQQPQNRNSFNFQHQRPEMANYAMSNSSNYSLSSTVSSMTDLEQSGQRKFPNNGPNNNNINGKPQKPPRKSVKSSSKSKSIEYGALRGNLELAKSDFNVSYNKKENEQKENQDQQVPEAGNKEASLSVAYQDDGDSDSQNSQRLNSVISKGRFRWLVGWACVRVFEK